MFILRVAPSHQANPQRLNIKNSPVHFQSVTGAVMPAEALCARTACCAWTDTCYRMESAPRGALQASIRMETNVSVSSTTHTHAHTHSNGLTPSKNTFFFSPVQECIAASYTEVCFIWWGGWFDSASADHVAEMSVRCQLQIVSIHEDSLCLGKSGFFIESRRRHPAWFNSNYSQIWLMKRLNTTSLTDLPHCQLFSSKLETEKL